MEKRLDEMKAEKKEKDEFQDLLMKTALEADSSAKGKLSKGEHQREIEFIGIRTIVSKHQSSIVHLQKLVEELEFHRK